MQVFQSKQERIKGTSYGVLVKRARMLFDAEAKRTKRTPYIRSPYFGKEKIFLNLFWVHLGQKPQRERKYRLRYVACAFDLLHNSTVAPVSKLNPNNPFEKLHRFAGVSKDGNLFFVQVKEELKSKRKYFMSVFSPK
ncbi:MAG: hypothetical protein LBL86_05330 [Coriobacteriales bacterium]|nr:hypothetical protein [Coriobacteriales bacterium]